MKKITIIGGDKRLRVAKKRLEAKGFYVDSIGLFEKDDGNYENSDVLLFPVPTTKDNATVFCPLTGRVIRLSEFENLRDKLFLTANYTFKNTNCIDYCKDDGYSLLNAIPTAEGAISFAIENTERTIFGSNVLVIGYGRTGKILADRLKALGAIVTVSARKQRDFALVSALGMKYRHSALLDSEELCYDIIFNTVDFFVLNKNLETLKNTLLIDLSSKGGFDLDQAKKLGVSSSRLPGIPGKTAPLSAGEILADTVINLIQGERI